MKLNLLLFCVFSGLTTVLSAPEMEKKAAANSLDTSPAIKGNGDVLADAVITVVTHVRTASMPQVAVGVLPSQKTPATASGAYKRRALCGM
ncbi:hypothetical protein GX51_06114 [Blastomyces parvus]|uniref:Uncharacterized protein n=1 Tax=Blastomyces parvus TaxID=2060905 RepID=A0A2B7WT99_9EURO|nr:hypothetical protein GX51_06114 [Blastomyces parvus]